MTPLKIKLIVFIRRIHKHAHLVLQSFQNVRTHFYPIGDVSRHFNPILKHCWNVHTTGCKGLQQCHWLQDIVTLFTWVSINAIHKTLLWTVFPLVCIHVKHDYLVYRGFWSVSMLVGVAAVVAGGFIIICAAPFASHRLYKAGGGLYLISGKLKN